MKYFLFLLLVVSALFIGCTEGAKKLERRERTHVRKEKLPERKKISLYRSENSFSRPSIFRKLSVKPEHFLSAVSGGSLFELGMHFEDVSVFLSRPIKAKNRKYALEMVKDLAETMNDLGVGDEEFDELINSGILPGPEALEELFRKCNDKLAHKGIGIHAEIMQLGGWIEHLHLVMVSKEFESKEFRNDFLALNKITAHNLMMALVEKGEAEEADTYLNDLNNIIKLLDKFENTEEPVVVEKGSEGEYLISGGAKFETDQILLEELRNSITTIRNQK